jgi:hypothetical protein
MKFDPLTSSGSYCFDGIHGSPSQCHSQWFSGFSHTLLSLRTGRPVSFSLNVESAVHFVSREFKLGTTRIRIQREIGGPVE